MKFDSPRLLCSGICERISDVIEGVRLVEFYESQMLAKTCLNIEQNGKKHR